MKISEQVIPQSLFNNAFHINLLLNQPFTKCLKIFQVNKLLGGIPQLLQSSWNNRINWDHKIPELSDLKDVLEVIWTLLLSDSSLFH